MPLDLTTLNLSDRQVLERMSTYLYEHYKCGRKLSGLLFLRDINLSRMTGSMIKYLDMFQRLCGEETFKNIILLTTKWDKSPEFAHNRESELVNKFWAVMIKLGSSHPKRLGKVVDPSSGIVNPVSDIIAPILKFQPTFLQIQRELGGGSDLIDTAAGQYIDRDLSIAIPKYKESSDSAMAQAEKTSQPQVKEALAGQAAIHDEELKRAKEDKEALREDFKKVMKPEAERHSELFGYGMLSFLDDYVTDKYSLVRFYTVGVASMDLFEVCQYLWKKQGKSQGLIKSAKDAMSSI
ncbi:MAG: hypothetical protein Q9201_002222 [Fulgogasparrea decipioides]